eukprot:8180-Heterococcus_DN1.PRE.3
MGTSSINFSRTSEAFILYEPNIPAFRWTYALSALEGGMRALSFAQETYIRISNEGIMCIQHQHSINASTAYACNSLAVTTCSNAVSALLNSCRQLHAHGCTDSDEEDNQMLLVDADNNDYYENDDANGSQQHQQQHQQQQQYNNYDQQYDVDAIGVE